MFVAGYGLGLLLGSDRRIAVREESVGHDLRCLSPGGVVVGQEVG